MFIWINRALALLVCAGLLAACDPSVGARSWPVLGGAVRVAAPQGYCITPNGVLQQQNSAIVLIGRCAGATGSDAVLTAAVGAEGSGTGVAGNTRALATFFASARGRAVLSRSGRSDTVQVRQVLRAGDTVLIRLRDRSPAPDGLIDSESWRAVMAVKGRLVTLTVAGTRTNPLRSTDGRAVLVAFMAATLAANRSAP